MSSRRRIFSAMLVAAGIGLARFYRGDAVQEPPVALAPVRSAAQQPSWFGVENHILLPAEEVKALPLPGQVDKLLATGKPEDQYKAYWLIQDCVFFLEKGDLYTQGAILPGANAPQLIGMNKAQKETETLLCKDMTERMRSSRFDYLASAARAGVIGANIEFYNAGPFGDRTALDTRPNDPLVLDWKQLAFNQLNDQAMDGELLSLSFLTPMLTVGIAGMPPDPQLALTYQLAQVKMVGVDASFPASMIDRSHLTPQQIADAEAGANRIAANWKRRLARRLP
jgi:hypothetical protein